MSCQFPLCKRHAGANGFCLFHRQYSGYSGEVRERAAPNKKSEKQEKLDKEYKKIVREMLAADDRCEVRSPECTGAAQGLHHVRRRGSNLLNRKYLKRSCNACNSWIERNPLKAIELGILIRVHVKQDGEK